MSYDRQFNAEKILEEALQKHNINLATLVAETALWANPDVHKRLAEKGNLAWFPKIRRARGKTEKRGNFSEEGIKFDDNTAANQAIKKAIGINRKDINGYETCHIWEKTCYDERYHTAVANLVLLPRSLASLTDHYKPIKEMLKYRAYELYGWHPEGTEVPKKPNDYVLNWRDPEPDILGQKSLRKVKTKTSSELIDKQSIERKLSGWYKNKNLNVHKIINLLLENEVINKDKFIELLKAKKISRNPYGAVSSLMSNKGNSYGIVFKVDEENNLYFHPYVVDHLCKIGWK